MTTTTTTRVNLVAPKHQEILPGFGSGNAAAGAWRERPLPGLARLEKREQKALLLLTEKLKERQPGTPQAPSPDERRWRSSSRKRSSGCPRGRGNALHASKR
jgi:hypothetical protein